MVCGKEIVVVGNQITCSIECRKKRRKYMMRKYHQKYNEKNKEKISKRRKKYYEDNKDSLLKKRKEYKQKNRDKILKWHKDYYYANRDVILSKQRAYYYENRDAILKRQKQHYDKDKAHLYYEKNKDKKAEYSKRYYKENKDKIAEYNKRYYKENKNNILNRQRDYHKSKIKEYYSSLSNITEVSKNDLEKIIPIVFIEREIECIEQGSYFIDFICVLHDRANNRCEFTGCKSNNLVIHHLNGYNWYIEGRMDVDNAVVIDKEVHDVFHDKYGRGDNTKEQWEEFVENYNKGVTTLDDFIGDINEYG